MSNYWKDKLVPKVRQILSLDKPGKKKLAADACKSFDESKEEFEKVLVEKKEELTPKVIEIYEAQSLAVKGVVKDRKTQALKKNSKACQQFLDELVKIEFPGSAPASEASAKYGSLVLETVFYVFEKVITFIPVEELKKEEAEEKKAEEEAEASIVEETTRDLPIPPPETTTTEPTTVVEEAPSAAAVVVAEEKKEEVVVVEEKKEEAAAPAPPPAAEPKK